VNFNNGELCPDEAKKLRDLLVETIEPNDDSTFEGQ
jgi:hypothetical protein